MWVSGGVAPFCLSCLAVDPEGVSTSGLLELWSWYPGSGNNLGGIAKLDKRQPLYFQAPDGMVVAAAVEGGGAFAARSPVALFAFRPSGSPRRKDDWTASNQP